VAEASVSQFGIFDHGSSLMCDLYKLLARTLQTLSDPYCHSVGVSVSLLFTTVMLNISEGK